MPELGRPRVAVIGGGVSGLTAAYALRETHEVTLLESAERLGGHADTHDVEVRGRADLPVDTGFIVHNDRTYPVLGRVFRELGVEVRDTEMSMSISCAECGLAYVGGRGLTGVLAQPRRVADRMFIALLKQIPRFHRVARQLLRDAPRSDRRTLGQFVGDHRFSRYFVHHFVVPLVSCVWSSGHQDALGYPARFLFEFLHHHGMLSVTGSPTWRTVVGGSGSMSTASPTPSPTCGSGSAYARSRGPSMAWRSRRMTAPLSCSTRRCWLSMPTLPTSC